jgi:putative transposase
VLTEHGLQIAPSTYYAHRTRPPSARALRDAELLVEIKRVHSSRKVGRGLYGYRRCGINCAARGSTLRDARSSD